MVNEIAKWFKKAAVHLVLQWGTDTDCPLAENLEDISRDICIYRSVTQKANSDLTLLGNCEWEPCHIMEYGIINRMPVIPVKLFFLRLQQMFNECLLFPRCLLGIWGHHKKPHPCGASSLVNYHTVTTMPLGKSLHLGRCVITSCPVRNSKA